MEIRWFLPGIKTQYSQSESSSEYGIFEQSIHSCGFLETAFSELDSTLDHKKDLLSSVQFNDKFNGGGFCFKNHDLPYLFRKDKCFLPVLRI
jgi:hypothetical protein